ncbi:MAG: GNAT family N-acetyltransferase [Atopobiaceae bacterium]|jgi:GNAT superfamily N-acetyltransferase|nr:GNAT family N-acetyltransferase [Atopobiaceae bacterium]MCI2172643.1 GNAT family N-acetyltransferase [Atopobiaceae bacterium]MCI2206950.1 GNAT family N-acetyltransferase [Atopobiaceae bacterium]
MRMVFQERLDDALAPEVLRILERCDADFVPPLSARSSTHQTALTGLTASGGVQGYFDELRGQPFVLALDGDHVIGFLSFIPGYSLHGEVRGDYVTTVCTLPERRGEGIATALYGRLEELTRPHTLLIRTWSTNEGQVCLLGRLGFVLVERVIDDRGPGVDTLYLAKGEV